VFGLRDGSAGWGFSCRLTFEVRRDRRQDARPGLVKMYAYHQPGPGGLPLGLASTAGLGVAFGEADMWNPPPCSPSQARRLVFPFERYCRALEQGRVYTVHSVDVDDCIRRARDVACDDRYRAAA
jgi:hypothetical protein